MSIVPAVIRQRDPAIIKRGENVAEAARQAGIATSKAAEADASAATAEAASGPTYASTAAGLAATTDGQAFAVNNGDGTVTVYLNDAGVAVSQRTLATVAFLASTAPGQGASAIKTTGGETLQEFSDGFRYHTPASDYATETAAETAAASEYSVTGGPYFFIPDGLGGLLVPDNQNVYYPEQIGIVADTVLAKEGLLDTEGTNWRNRLQYMLDVIEARGGGTIVFEAKGLSRTYGIKQPLVLRDRVALVGDGANIFNMATSPGTGTDRNCFLPGVYTGGDGTTIFDEPSTHVQNVADAAQGDKQVVLDAADTASIAVGDIITLVDGNRWLAGGNPSSKRAKYIFTREVNSVSGTTIGFEKPLQKALTTGGSSPQIIKSSGTLTDVMGNVCKFVRDARIEGLRFGQLDHATDNRGICGFGASLRGHFDYEVMEGSKSAFVANLQVDSFIRTRGKATYKWSDHAYGTEDIIVDHEGVMTKDTSVVPGLMGERALGVRGRYRLEGLKVDTATALFSISDSIDANLDVELNAPLCNGMNLLGTSDYFPEGCVVRARIEGSSTPNYGLTVSDAGGATGARNTIEVVSHTTWAQAPVHIAKTTTAPVTVIVKSAVQAAINRARAGTDVEVVTIDAPKQIPAAEALLDLTAQSNTLTPAANNDADVSSVLDLRMNSDLIRVGDVVKIEGHFRYTSGSTADRFIRFYDKLFPAGSGSGDVNALTYTLPASQTNKNLVLRGTVTFLTLALQNWHLRVIDEGSGTTSDIYYQSTRDYSVTGIYGIKFAHKLGTGTTMTGYLKLSHEKLS